MTHDLNLENKLEALVQRVEELEGEAAIRRLQARYMFLCDTPCPEFGIQTDKDRIDRIMDLYTEDAIWEGVGEYYTNQFGRCIGKAAIRTHFENFWLQKRDPALILNVHYLTSEQIHVHGNTGDGQWVHCQPWIFNDGSSLLRSSRLNNLFRKENGVWKISRTRTENVFISPLPKNWTESIPSRSFLMDEDK